MVVSCNRWRTAFDVTNWVMIAVLTDPISVQGSTKGLPKESQTCLEQISQTKEYYGKYEAQ